MLKDNLKQLLNNMTVLQLGIETMQASIVLIHSHMANRINILELSNLLFITCKLGNNS